MSVETTLYKKQLETALVEITKELETLGVHNPDVKEDWIATPSDPVTNEPDPNDVGDRNEDWEERRATLSVLETRYNNLRRALKKIEAGTYGICEISGEEIESDRLDANPAARTDKAHMDDESSLAQ